MIITNQNLHDVAQRGVARWRRCEREVPGGGGPPTR